jgi:UDP-N-acetylmuramoyl-tripeptide--D-alanyl-D-alanine ligase
MIVIRLFKSIGKIFLALLLEHQVKRLRKRHKFDVVAVAGSVGKTSTKTAIAETLQNSRRVLWQDGNYNDRLTVPLIFFNQKLPGLFNVVAWTRILIKNERAIYGSYDYDIVVVEIGTDAPGQIKHFKYLKPEALVISAITPEHMQNFTDLNAVAKEELAIVKFAHQTFINIDDSAAEYLNGLEYVSYGLQEKADYHMGIHQQLGLRGQKVRLFLPGARNFEINIPMLGEQGAKMAVAAVAVADMLGLSLNDIKAGLATVESSSGRMRVLGGVNNSTLIDDTYNASPVATIAALDVLHKADAPQHVAILGSMNELGDYSRSAHQEIGNYCDPNRIDLIVTIGEEAGKYLAPAARETGCAVESFDSPYEAGEFVSQQLQNGAVVLAKGSQNGVFAEEALKYLLANKSDESKLVRQSPYWLKVKQKQFKI